jgi:hypothetical protein
MTDIDQPFAKLLRFLDRLEESGLQYFLGHFRETINVLVTTPSARWEVEFFADGHIEVEVFRSQGEGMRGEEALAELFADDE